METPALTGTMMNTLFWLADEAVLKSSFSPADAGLEGLFAFDPLGFASVHNAVGALSKHISDFV